MLEKINGPVINRHHCRGLNSKFRIETNPNPMYADPPRLVPISEPSTFKKSVAHKIILESGAL
jgi:hypothetical protein